MCVYLLMAKLKKQLELPQSLNEIQQILSVTIFEKTLLISVFFDNFNKNHIYHNPNQILLFDL